MNGNFHSGINENFFENFLFNDELKILLVTLVSRLSEGEARAGLATLTSYGKVHLILYWNLKV